MVVLLPTAVAASTRTVAGGAIGADTVDVEDVIGPATIVGNRSCNGIDVVGRAVDCIDEEDGVENVPTLRLGTSG